MIKQPESCIHKESGCLVSLESVHGCRNGYTFEQHAPPVELNGRRGDRNTRF